MVKEMINSSSFNPIYINVTPSLNLAHGKIRLSSNISYVHEWHSGLFHINNGYWGLYPTLYCRLGKFWAVNLNYAYSSGEGYMRGSSNLTRFSDNLKLGFANIPREIYLLNYRLIPLYLKMVIRRVGLSLIILIVILIKAVHGIDAMCHYLQVIL